MMVPSTLAPHHGCGTRLLGKLWRASPFQSDTLILDNPLAFRDRNDRGMRFHCDALLFASYTCCDVAFTARTLTRHTLVILVLLSKAKKDLAISEQTNVC